MNYSSGSIPVDPQKGMEPRPHSVSSSLLGSVSLRLPVQLFSAANVEVFPLFPLLEGSSQGLVLKM